MYSTPKEKWLTDPPDGALMTEAEAALFRQWFEALPDAEVRLVLKTRIRDILKKNGDRGDPRVTFSDEFYTEKEAEKLIQKVQKENIRFHGETGDGFTVVCFGKDDIVWEIRKRTRRTRV